MTRACLNFRFQKAGEGPRTLYHYHNGDQYPSGLQNCFNVEQLLNNFTPDGFREWIRENYEAEAQEIDHPCIYYDDAGYITDYSYVFAPDSVCQVLAYKWDKQIFSGSVVDFKKWLAKQSD